MQLLWVGCRLRPCGKVGKWTTSNVKNRNLKTNQYITMEWGLNSVIKHPILPTCPPHFANSCPPHISTSPEMILQGHKQRDQQCHQVRKCTRTLSSMRFTREHIIYQNKFAKNSPEMLRSGSLVNKICGALAPWAPFELPPYFIVFLSCNSCVAAVQLTGAAKVFCSMILFDSITKILQGCERHQKTPFFYSKRRAT